MLILLNLFIAVVMEEFSSFKNTRHERLRLDNFLVRNHLPYVSVS